MKQLVNRALQIATSDPKGPAYLTASREALEQVSSKLSLDFDHIDISQEVPRLDLDQERWGATIPSTLPESGKYSAAFSALPANFGV